MHSRKLRFSTAHPTATLKLNNAHEFAHKHAISIFASNTVYSMVPKSACTTLRFSVALANGAIDSEKDYRWTHRNNDTFRPSLRELALADYTFIVLRCPFQRLASCFLDKFVSRRTDAWALYELVGDEIDMPRLTFRQFCRTLKHPVARTANIHWRPQTDFMVYETYDDYFHVKQFATVVTRLKERIGLDVIDARPFVRHDSSHYKPLPDPQNFADEPVHKIEQIMMKGLRPAPESQFDDEVRDMVESSYAEDLAMFRQHFPGAGMFDGQQKLAAAS